MNFQKLWQAVLVAVLAANSSVEAGQGKYIYLKLGEGESA
jgi:hypothetical protein